MQRATVYRSKPDDNWQELLDILSSTTFFLMARIGPTVFNIKDESGKLFKVMISNPHTCSCNTSSRNNLCVHQLFVLLKVLKIAPSHPLSYQSSLTDSEITQVLSGSCGVPASANRISSNARRQSSSSSSQKGDAAGNKEGFVHRQELDEDGFIQCPICQDDMSKDQALTWCRKGCGNNIHAKCMHNYSQYKISTKEAACCPLCRVEWALDLLKGDCRGQASLKYSCSPVYCTVCTFPQRAAFNRCIECSQNNFLLHKKAVDFCVRCFSSIGREHSSHHFLSSDASTIDINEIQWLPIINPKALPQVMDREMLIALQQRELSVQDYDTLLDLDNRVPDLPTQLMKSLLVDTPVEPTALTLGRTLSVTSTSTTTSPSISSPCWCRGQYQGTLEESQKRRMLLCKHTCHDGCLRKCILESISESGNGVSTLLCGHSGCGSKIFPGLLRIRKRKAAVVPTGAVANTDGRDQGAVVRAGSVSVSEPTLLVSATGSGPVGGRVRGALRVGSSLRLTPNTGMSDQGVGMESLSLGVEGSGISVAGPVSVHVPVHESRGREPLTTNSASNSNKENREGRRISSSRGRGTERSLSGTGTGALALGSRSDLDIGGQSMFMSVSGIAGLSTVSQVNPSNAENGEHRHPPSDQQSKSARRLTRPPRPRASHIGSVGGVDVSGLDIQGLTGSLHDTANSNSNNNNSGSRPTHGIEYILSSTAPLTTSTPITSALPVDSTVSIGDRDRDSNRGRSLSQGSEEPRSRIQRRVELSRSAGSLREHRDQDSTAPPHVHTHTHTTAHGDAALTVGNGAVSTTASTSTTNPNSSSSSASSSQRAIHTSPNGIIELSHTYSGSVSSRAGTGTDPGSDLIPSRSRSLVRGRSRVRAAVGDALRDAVILEGMRTGVREGEGEGAGGGALNGSSIASQRKGESERDKESKGLSLILSVNGHSHRTSNPSLSTSTSTTVTATNMAMIPSMASTIRRGRPSPYRRPSIPESEEATTSTSMSVGVTTSAFVSPHTHTQDLNITAMGIGTGT